MSYIFGRALESSLVLWGVCTISFLLLHLTPGDPVDLMLGENAAFSERQAVRHELGLDLPLEAQYLGYLKNLSHFDLGKSYLTKRSVTQDIADHLLPTFELGMTSVVFSFLIGLPLGILSAVKKNSWLDKFLFSFSIFGMSVPSFWLAPILIIIFSIKLDLFPVSGREGALSLFLPSLSLAFGLSSVFIRMTRASLLEVLNEDYVRTARCKGVSELTVICKHALKNAFSPILTTLGFQLGALLTGIVITETIFDWPGIGTVLYQGLQERNYPLVQGCILFISSVYVLVNFLTDLGYLALNPKLREEIA